MTLPKLSPQLPRFVFCSSLQPNDDGDGSCLLWNARRRPCQQVHLFVAASRRRSLRVTQTRPRTLIPPASPSRSTGASDALSSAQLCKNFPLMDHRRSPQNSVALNVLIVMAARAIMSLGQVIHLAFSELVAFRSPPQSLQLFLR